MMRNRKSQWVSDLYDMKKIGADLNLIKDRCLTFVTPIGLIEGEKDEFNVYDLSDEGALADQIQKGEVRVIDLALSQHLERMKDPKYEYYDQDKIVYLKNVKIIMNNGNTIRVSTFLLFIDQIIGILPASMD